MDPMLLIGGGIAALLLTKKKAEPVTAAQVQAKTDEIIQQRAPDAIGACVKLVKPPFVFPPEPAWMVDYQADNAAIMAKHGRPTYGTPAYALFQADVDAMSAKYQSRINEKLAIQNASMAKWNSDWEAVLESYRQQGWKITQVKVGGIVPAAQPNYPMMEKLAGMGQIGAVMGSVLSTAIQAGSSPAIYSGQKMSQSPLTYACPPGTLPIEYQGAIANSIKKNECIVLRSTDAFVTSCMCGSAYTAVPQDVIDALKAKGWTEKTVTPPPPPPPPPAPGAIPNPWEAIVAMQYKASTTYLCPPGKDPAQLLSSAAPPVAVAAPVENWGYEVPPPSGTMSTMALVPYSVCDAAGNVVKKGQFRSGGWSLNLNPGYKRC